VLVTGISHSTSTCTHRIWVLTMVVGGATMVVAAVWLLLPTAHQKRDYVHVQAKDRLQKSLVF
jgi:hypothetical protein